jgi:hypothetical protein
MNLYFQNGKNGETVINEGFPRENYYKLAFHC